jgi:para-nitrobenzyl esterase
LTAPSLRNLFAAFALFASAASAQTVQTESGAVRGETLPQGGTAFQGIPFAAPPLDNLRWKKPMPAARWTGVFDATRPAASCVQNDYGWNHADFLIGREDCLTLDVRTPAIAGKRPVLVWIHGGGNYAGSPGGMTLSPLGKDLVLVAVRYRLAIFGFLSHPALTAEAGASGNYALMDQIAALQWVKRNIARFGGDPGNITIAGESAGSQDVGLLLAAPAARTLFHKAIMESGTPGFGLPFRPLREAELMGTQADDLLGAGGDLAKLRSMSVPALLAVDRQLHDDAIQTEDYKWLRTTIDGAVFPRSPRELLESAPARPVLIGSNRFELDAPGGRPHRDAFVAKAFGRNAAAARSYYRFDQPEGPVDPRLGNRDQQLGTDVTFRCPAIEMAQLLAAKGATVWHYEFDAAPGGARSVHAGEIPYIWGDQKLGNGMSLGLYWAQFARTGDPNAAGLPNWPRFTLAQQAHVQFDDRGVTPLGPLRPEVCSLLDAL